MTPVLTIILSIFRFIVIPVQFQDKELECDAAAIEERFACVTDYYRDQFHGSITYQFDIAEPVKMPGNLEYYGRNRDKEHDVLLYECAIQAAQTVSRNVNLNNYGDPIFLFCPGSSEDISGDPESIWPQYSLISSKARAPIINGREIDAFIAVTEQTTMGTICHEMGHMLGLPDFYDTDDLASGGISVGLWGSTSLMDYGCRNNGGATPPFLNAIERSIVGIGTSDTLSVGHYHLTPISTAPYHLIAPTTRKGRDLLIECRDNSSWDKFIGGKGLLILDVNRSEDFIHFWDENKVNCNPANPGVSIISADAQADDPRQIFFPQPGRHALSLCSHNINLALRSITPCSDGAVEFDVIEPFNNLTVTTFQDAAIISWERHPSLNNYTSVIRWKEDEEEEKIAETGTKNTFTIDGLLPHFSYKFMIEITDDEGEKYTIGGTFRTKSAYDGLKPSINLSTAERNSDGSFVQGTRIPLRINNSDNMISCEWFFNGSPIHTSDSGYYAIPGNGTLKARMIMEDGSTTVIVKKINVR